MCYMLVLHPLVRAATCIMMRLQPFLCFLIVLGNAAALNGGASVLAWWVNCPIAIGCLVSTHAACMLRSELAARSPHCDPMFPKAAQHM